MRLGHIYQHCNQGVVSDKETEKEEKKDCK
jgi:hypothetical protein